MSVVVGWVGWFGVYYGIGKFVLCFILCSDSVDLIDVMFGSICSELCRNVL